MSAPSLLALPLELQEQVVRHLGFPDNVSLRMTCRHFFAIIKPLTHEQLLSAENTGFSLRKDVYAYRDCLRLRPASRFADNMTKKKRGKYGPEDYKRFCVECGLKSGPGNTRYTRGSRIMIQAECLGCGARTRAFREELRQREEQFQRAQERARRRAERDARRAKRRELYGDSDIDDDWDSGELSPSLTWSEEQMEMVQAEADLYMNSPGPGSD